MQGIQGEPGENGQDGRSFTPAIGNTTTLNPGSYATVSTSYDMVQDTVYFNFGIPEGKKGDKGDTGPAPDLSLYPTFATLEAYPKFTDISNPTKTGVVKGNTNSAFLVGQDGGPYAGVYTNEQYQSLANDAFISKGTIANVIQTQIDAITASSDVVDIVGTYTELQNYDTTKLTADDIIKVLEDSTHSDAISYYRWVITGGTGAWSYIGSEGPFFTKSEIQSTYATIEYVDGLVGDVETLLENLDIGDGING